jgi:uncharacterized protein
MLVVLSPAKSLDFESFVPTTQFSKPIFTSEARLVNAALKDLSPAQLAELMDISDQLSQLNWQRNQKRTFSVTGLNDHARQAIFAFSGDVYQGFDAYSLPGEFHDELQSRLRILSGLYGLLRPLDVIQPYRLEMGTKLQAGQAVNLHAFWKPLVTKVLQKELKKHQYLLNLASAEYFGAVDQKALKVPVITPEFKDYHQGKLKMISFFAKKARGMMARYVISAGITTPEGLKSFSSDGYVYDAQLSSAERPVFTR